MRNPNNPPAFPCKYKITKGESNYTGYSEGLSIRDYFAAKAMQSQLLDSDTDGWHNLTRAENAYKLADAMLKEREKNQDQ